MIMTFGKYKGWPIEELPTKCLEWLIENTFNKKHIQTIEKELEYRYKRTN